MALKFLEHIIAILYKKCYFNEISQNQIFLSNKIFKSHLPLAKKTATFFDNWNAVAVP